MQVNKPSTFQYPAPVRILQWLLAGVLWCYIIYRAFTVAITQDEAYTYYLVKKDFWRSMPGSANTHWLTSLFMRLCLWLPGPDRLWKLRLLPVLCWPLFSWCVIRYTRFFRNRWPGHALFAMLLFNPVLLLYFSLARGYAPGCTLLLLSLVLAAGPLQENDFHPRRWMPAFMVGSLAVLANFSFFYCYIPFSCIYLLQLYSRKQLALLKERPGKIMVLLVAGTYVFSMASLLFIKYSGDLEYGGSSGLIDSLIGSLLTYSSYLPLPASALTVIAVMIALLLLVFFAVGIRSYTRSRQLTLHRFVIGIATGVVVLNMSFHFLFKTPYLLGRTALVLYLPLVAGIAGGLDETSYVRVPVRRLITGLSAALVLLLGYNLYKGFNIRYFTEWSIQSDTQKCLVFLKAHGSPKTGMDEWHASVYDNYYRQAFPDCLTLDRVLITQEEVVHGSGKIDSSGIEYLLLSPPYDKSRFPSHWKEVLYYPDSKALLLKVR